MFPDFDFRAAANMMAGALIGLALSIVFHLIIGA